VLMKFRLQSPNGEEGEDAYLLLPFLDCLDEDVHIGYVAMFGGVEGVQVEGLGILEECRERLVDAQGRGILQMGLDYCG
jgi:hypothetical protein